MEYESIENKVTVDELDKEAIVEKGPYEENEWKHLLDMSYARHTEHKKTSYLWSFLFYIFSITLIIISGIVTAEGAGDFISKNTLFVLGIISTTISAIMPIVNSGAKYSEHLKTSKSFKTIYLDIRKCDTVQKFLELQDQYTKVYFDAPGVPSCFSSKLKQIVIMNPHLREEFEDFFNEKNKKPLEIITHEVRSVNEESKLVVL